MATITIPVELIRTAEQKAAEARAGFVLQVKVEAARRIDAIMPDYQQRNVLAQGMEATQLYGADPSGWPPDLQAINADVQAKWAAIKIIRTRSDAIEAMELIPADFREDEYWI